MSARGMILKSNVTHLCTTDDPADSLEWHKKIKADKSFNVQVLPAWRPEAAMKIADKGFATYVRRLAGAAEMDIGSYDDFKAAMIKRLEFLIRWDAVRATTVLTMQCMSRQQPQR